MEKPMVHISGLNRRFGSNVALRDINLDIPEGRIVGLLGANGSGKTTLIRHIIGLYLPDQGTCETLGCASKTLGEKELSRLGYVDQQPAMIDWMRGDQFLRFVRAYYSTWNTQVEQKLVTEWQIPLNQRIAAMSPGQQQTLAIVAAVAFEPDLLLLDEPAAGLDPIARAKLMEFLLDVIQDSEKTILISSHILSDIEKVVDHVLILKEGRLIRDCSLDALREDYCQLTIVSRGTPLPEPLPFNGIVESKRNGLSALLKIRGQSREQLLGRARQSGYEAEAAGVSLDDIYRLEMEQG